jgi:hypothetical protein
MSDQYNFFGNPTDPSQLSYAQLQQRRAIAQALASRQKGFPKNKGEGLTYLGESIGEALQDLALQRREALQRTKDASSKYTPATKTEPPPTAKIDAPQTTAAPQAPAVIDRPPPPQAPAQAPAPAPAPAAATIPGGPWTAPAITAPPPWPTSEAVPPNMPSFNDRFADAVAQPPPPSAASAQQENTFFQPELATPSFSGGTVADLTPADIPPMPAQRASITAPAPPPQQTAMASPPPADPQMMMFARQEERPPEPPPVSQAPEQAPIEVAPSAPVPAPDVPLPMGDPRTVGGVRSTVEATAARGGMNPNAIGGLMPNIRDESGFNPALSHWDPTASERARGDRSEGTFSHGLYQERGEEWNKYKDWVAQNYPGYDWRDPKLETQFLAQNLQSPEYQKVFDRMQSADRPGTAAASFVSGYLKPAKEYENARVAAYLGGGAGQGPEGSTQVATGGGAGSGGVRDREGAPVDQRDLITEAMLAQPQQQPQQVAQEEPQQPQTSDARLLEMLGGGRRPGSPFLPTASIGREGAVRSDAPLPGLSPMGSLGGGPDASLQDRRDAITRAVIDQPVTAPEVPQPDPTQSGTSPSPTTASLPPTSPSVISDSSTVPPMGATAQAAIPLAPPVGYSVAAGRDTSQGIVPAPAQAPAQQDVPRQQIAMPPVRPDVPRPDPGPEPTLQSVMPAETAREMAHQRAVAQDLGFSDPIRTLAKARYDELHGQVQDLYTKEWGLWKDKTDKAMAWDAAKNERARAEESHTLAQGTGIQAIGLKEQERIAGTPTAPGAAAPGAAGAGADPRLGTSQSPQRSGVPTTPPVPPGITPAKWAELQAPVQVAAIEGIQKAVPQFDDAIKAIQQARDHPGREWGLGFFSSAATKVPGTDAYAFGKLNEQMAGKNFLNAYQLLRGSGQISNIEGEKASAAQARLATAQNPKDYDAALNDLELQLRRDLETSQRKVNAPVTAWRGAGDNSSYAPDIGQRRGDSEYIGGNPASQSSWKKIR